MCFICLTQSITPPFYFYIHTNFLPLLNLSRPFLQFSVFKAFAFVIQQYSETFKMQFR
jgi:hypothetical protein